MRTLTAPARGANARRGLSMVECMISLVIAATLLTAVGVAFTSTAKAMEYNDQFFRATQAARVSLNQMVSQVRRGTPSPKDAFDQTITLTDNQSVTAFRMITAGEKEVIYKYDATTKELQMYPVVANVIATTPYVLAHDVTDARIVVGIGTYANLTKYVTRISVSVTVQKGNNTIRLSGSAVPRVTMTY
jgi:prepilin-type N-terminal cleavage/methylation domain-containing protein